jgi:hypothetical protein
MRAQVLCSGAIGRRSRVHHAALKSRSVTLLSLRSPRSYAANDKRSLPQSARRKGNGPDLGLTLDHEPPPYALQATCHVPSFFPELNEPHEPNEPACDATVTLLSLRPLR